MPSGPRLLKWARTAEQDIREIWAYYASEASTEIANNIVDLIRATASQLSAHPLSGRPRNEVTPGVRSVVAHPYLIFYRVQTNVVEIARVIHQRRDLQTAISEAPKK